MRILMFDYLLLLCHEFYVGYLKNNLGLFVVRQGKYLCSLCDIQNFYRTLLFSV